MLNDKDKKLIQLLIALAWADGRVAEEEMEVVEAVVAGFGATPTDAEEIRAWAKTPHTLDDIDTKDLDLDDAHRVLYQAVFLTFIDGEQTVDERALLDTFVAKIGLPKAQADLVLEAATARAQEILPLLSA